jgi:hypothetical protein
MAASAEVPPDTVLRRLAGLDLPYSGDVLDHDPGSLTFIDAVGRRVAAHTLEFGESSGLNLPLDLIERPHFGRLRFQRRIENDGRNTLDDILEDFKRQSSSQWGSAQARPRTRTSLLRRTDRRNDRPSGAGMRR